MTKVVILAGGRGTRLAEETSTRPKPMVEIGGKPMIWHIMSIYAAHGFKEFLVACGYKGEFIKEYFRNAYLHSADFEIDLKDGALNVMNGSSIDWKIGLFDTGLDTMTGGRIRRLKQWVGGTTFMATYGDGLASVDIGALMAFHKMHGLGNDFVILDRRSGKLSLSEAQIRRIADRRLGVGCDQLLSLEPS